MLANGRTRPTLFSNNHQGINSSNEKSTNSTLQFSQTSQSLAPIPELHENGLEPANSSDRIILDELEDFTEGPKVQTIAINNNNKTKTWPSKMAAVNTSGPSQQLANTNGYPLPMVSNSGIPNKSGPTGMDISSSVHNNQLSNIMDQNVHPSNLTQPNPTSGSINMGAGGEPSSTIPSSSQYNVFNSRQDNFLTGFQSGSRSSSGRDIPCNPMMRGAPTTDQQYGSPQQRSYLSGSNDSQIRAINRQSQSPFPTNYFPQESHNNQTPSRVENSQSEERTFSSGEHFQWQQGLQRYSNSSKPSPSQSMNRSQMQQSGMPPRQPPPYMMMGQHLPPQPTQAPQQYMIHSQMKANTMSNQVQQQYYGMGNMMQRQQGMQAHQMQKAQQDYGSYQQQAYSHYSQPPSQYPSSVPPYIQSRQQAQQQSMSQSPSNMSRMVQSQQAILPKPAMDMYASQMGPSRYPSNMNDPSMDFQGPSMNEHVQQQPQHRPPQQQSFPSPSGIVPPSDGPTMPVNQRGYYPGYPGSPSPNVTMGSPLRNLPEGFQPNSAMPGQTLPGGSATPTFPNTPSSSGMPSMFPSNTTSHGAAAAAAAAVMQAANSKYPPPMAHQAADHSPHGYGAHDGMTASRGQMGVGPPVSSGTPMPPAGLPGMENSSGNNLETGQVPSPTLNMLPTAEDVEAMIQSMSSEEAHSMDGSRTPSQNCPPATTSSSKHSDLPSSATDSLGGATASPAQNVSQPNNSASPLSSFSEQFSPGVSISSFGGDDDNDGVSVPVDDITPTLGQSSNSLISKQHSKDNPQFGKYSVLYELSSEPERKEFLDKYSVFMESTGNPIRQIPVFNNQVLDIYKLYKVIKENGGLQEVVKRKLWDKVLISLNISPEQTLLSSQLRNHYSRFLLAYEMADVTKMSHSTPVDNLFDDTGVAPPNATVTCSEAIFPAPTMSASKQSGGTYMTGYSQTTSNGPQGNYTGYSNYQRNEGYIDGVYDSNKGYQTGPMDSRSPMTTPQSNSSSYVSPYPYGNDRSSHPNYRSYPQHAPSPQHFPGSAALSQLQQRSSTIPGYPQHPLSQGPGSMMAQQRTQQEPVHPMWSQYKASAEPEHMFDYPPNGQPTSRQPLYPSTRQQQPFPTTPHHYRRSPPPQGARSPSLSRQPVTSTHQTPSQLSKPKGNLVKKEFPLESVEATKPLFTKKRKLTSRDLGPVEAWRVMMSLKSGLLSETTWALDALNILLYDDHTVGYFLLSHLPGLLENLLDHFRRYLVEIFGAFWENEENDEQKATDDKNAIENVKVMEKTSEHDEKLQKHVSRSLTAFLAASALDSNLDQANEWWLNAGETTVHIQTHLGTDVTPKRCKYDNNEIVLEKTAETNCKLKISDSTVHDTEQCKAVVKPEVEPMKSENKVLKECDGKHCSKSENCVASLHSNEWDLDSDDSCSDGDNTSLKNSSAQKNDTCVFSQEEFTARLKQELDLDIDSTIEDSDSNAYIQSLINSRVQGSKNSAIIEEESIRTEESTLSLRTESDNALSRRCMCVSNILRGLSFVPGNDVEMFRNAGLLLILGKLLLLYHKHAKRVPYRHSFMQEDMEVDAPCDDQHDWWWQSLEVLRENALVIFSNIAGQLDLSVYPKAISTPILDGLLHWFVCQSAEAIDPMPTATVGTSLSAQQLVLESLAKMSILGGNTELILSASTSHLEALYATLVRLLGQRENPVSRELSLVVLSNLSQSDNDYACLAEKKQCIAMLLQFIEDAATSINAYSSGGSLAQAGFHSEDFCGTSVDMLRRAASSLVCLARCKPIRSLFLPFQERLLLLTTLKLLERMIGSQLADVLFYLSR